MWQWPMRRRWSFGFGICEQSDAGFFRRTPARAASVHSTLFAMSHAAEVFHGQAEILEDLLVRDSPASALEQPLLGLSDILAFFGGLGLVVYRRGG